MKKRKSKKIKYNPIKREEEIFNEPLTKQEKDFLDSIKLDENQEDAAVTQR